MFAGETDPPPPVHFPFEKTLIPAKDQIKHVALASTNADPWTSPATLPILFSMSNRWPSPFTFAQNCYAARYLMGPSLADWLSVPIPNFRTEVEYKVGTFVTNIPPRFSRMYRQGWDERRRDAMRKSIVFMVSWELGNRESPSGLWVRQNHCRGNI
jgi:hypothetical protein